MSERFTDSTHKNSLMVYDSRLNGLETQRGDKKRSRNFSIPSCLLRFCTSAYPSLALCSQFVETLLLSHFNKRECDITNNTATAHVQCQAVCSLKVTTSLCFVCIRAGSVQQYHNKRTISVRAECKIDEIANTLAA